MSRRGDSYGTRGTIALLLYSAVFLVGRVRCDWSLQDFAQDVCDSLAKTGDTRCNCVDIQISLGQAWSDLCGCSEALGPGLTVDSSNFTGWSDQTPTPSTEILLQQECDATNSTSNVACSITGGQTITSHITTYYHVGLNLEINLNFTLPSLRNDSRHYSFSFKENNYTCEGNTVSTSDSCGPGSAGQPTGTCSIYKETYNSYALTGGRGFTYDASVSGGVQMAFENPTDAQAAIGHESDGSLHYYWYFPIDEMVSYGQSLTGNILNSNQFTSPPNPNNFGNAITFHGSGVVNGQFLDVSTACGTSACN